MNRDKIVILDAATFGDVCLERLLTRWECTVHAVTSSGETAARLSGHSIVITNKVAIGEAVLSAPQARGLKLIAVAATGTDIIDAGAARRFGVRVCNVPNYATASVAQFTIALMLELASRTGRYGLAVTNGAWHTSPVFTLLTYPTVELQGKKLGVIGYGNIGRRVAAIGGALGMQVSIAARAGSSAPVPAGRTGLEELFRQCDVISLHAPLTPATRHLISAQTLALMKPSAFLINTARGALVDEEALIQALRAKQLAGAALDVLSREPPEPSDPIVAAARELENLIVTPHTAWSAREARERLIAEVEANVRAFLAGQERNVVA